MTLPSLVRDAAGVVTAPVRTAVRPAARVLRPALRRLDPVPDLPGLDLDLDPNEV